MGFFPFVPLSVPVTGGTFSGPVTIAGLLTTQAGVANSGAAIASTGQNITTTASVIGASGGNATTLGANITGSGTASLSVPGNVDVTLAGDGLRVAEGSNAKQGRTAAMTAGTITVANTSVTAGSEIIMSGQVLGGTAGGVNVSARTAGTSFTVTSTNAADTSAVGFQMFEPG